MLIIIAYIIVFLFIILATLFFEFGLKWMENPNQKDQKLGRFAFFSGTILLSIVVIMVLTMNYVGFDL